jgi:hypothetical protein
MQSQNFTQAPPDSVAPDRVSQRLFYAPSKPADFEAIGAKKNGKLAARPPATFAVHRIVLRSVHQPAGARQTQPLRVRRA